jgi:hypothetical protein
MNIFILIVIVSGAAANLALAAPEFSLPYSAPLGYKVVDAEGLVPIKSHNASAISIPIIAAGAFVGSMSITSLQVRCMQSLLTTAMLRTSFCLI